MLSTEFRPGYMNDKQAGISRVPKDAFLASEHNFESFLKEREDLPRFSILQNYEQIMRIMTSNYMKSTEREALYKNRTKKDLERDEEYAQFAEEQANTRKMAHILRRLNTPRKRTNMNYYNRELLRGE